MPRGIRAEGAADDEDANDLFGPDGEGIEEEAQEARPAARAARMQSQPTAEELAQHEALHEPYRSWCPLCVAGRAVSDRHTWQAPPDGAVSTIGIDYGYIMPRHVDGALVNEDQCTPFVMGKDNRHLWFYSVPVPSNGVQSRGLWSRRPQLWHGAELQG